MSRRAPRGWVIAAAALAVPFALPAPAGATEIVVTTFTDDLTGDDGKCTLREAVAAANNTFPPSGTPGECPAGAGSSDKITLPAGAYTVNHALPNINSARPLTIAGARAATTTLTQSLSERLFRVSGGVVVMQDITLANGHPATVLNNSGGAIYNDGDLTILRSVLTGNHTSGGGAGADHTGGASSGVGNAGTGGFGFNAYDGGAILNLGSLTVRDSTFSGNYTGNGGNGGNGTGGAGNFGTGAVGYEGGPGQGGLGASGGNGGAIYSVGELVIERTVFTGNHTGNGGSGGNGVGGTGGKGGGLAFAGGQGGTGVGGDGGPGGMGGAVAILGPSFGAPRNFTISGSTFVDNYTGTGGAGGSATGGAGGQGADGGIGAGGTGGAGRSGTAGSGGSGGLGGAIAGMDAHDLSVNSSVFEGNATGNGGPGTAGTGGAGGPGGAGASTGTGGPGGPGHGSDGGRGGPGGAVWSELETLANSTLTQNSAGDGANGGNGSGGAGGTPGGATGASTGGNGGNGGSAGGALSGLYTATHVTVSSNSVGTPGAAGSGGTPGAAGAAGTGGGFYGSAAWTLDNSVVASNTGGNCAGTAPTGTHNVSFPDASCPGTNEDPKLAALADNGGPTRTQALVAGSAARDLVPALGSQCALVDQRGVIRPQLAACDAGAYEVAPPSVTTGAAANVTATGASLAGSVNPHLLATSFHFEFGPTAAYGSSTSSQNAGAGNSATDVGAALSGLTHSTTYHYRVVASNTDGSSNGADQTFTTSAPGGSGDSTAPVIRSASMKPGKIKPSKGATLNYVLSEAAHVAVTVERVLPGRSVKGSCVRIRPSNLRKRKCKRYVRAGSFAADGAAGPNAQRFSGRIRGKALKRGRYRATLVATDAAGNRSGPRRVGFSIVARR